MSRRTKHPLDSVGITKWNGMPRKSTILSSAQSGKVGQIDGMEQGIESVLFISGLDRLMGQPGEAFSFLVQQNIGH